MKNNLSVSTFRFIPSDYPEWLSSFSRAYDGSNEPDGVHFNNDDVLGKARAGWIEDGLSYLVIDVKFNRDFVAMRDNNYKKEFIIFFRRYEVQDNYVFKMEDEMIELPADQYEAVVMHATDRPIRTFFKSGSTYQALAIHLSEEWIAKNVSVANFRKMEAYTDNGLKNFNKEPITPKHKKILEEVFSNKIEVPLPQLYLRSRMLRMTEYFLNDILEREPGAVRHRLNRETVSRLMQIEKKLTNDYLLEFPSVEELARMALMSESNLKKSFKQLFGKSLYEYYQKNRMHKAKEMLQTGKYSVSEVGGKLGYSNLSNFTIAFRKEFSYLPSEIA